MLENVRLEEGVADGVELGLGQVDVGVEADLQNVVDGAELEFGEEAASELAALELQSRARDQVAVSALQQALQELPRQSRRLGLQEQPLSRLRFVALLRTTLLRLLHAGPGSQPTGAEVLVGDLHALAGRSLAQLFVTGCSDSELLPRLPEDPLLSDDDRRALTRLLEAPVWPLCQEATERAPLLLIELLARCHVAHLSWPQTDDEGRPLLRASHNFIKTTRMGSY